MIKYHLQCVQHHEFEAWFSTSSAYDDQRERGLVSCPICDSGAVSKLLSAPNLNSPKLRKTPEPQMPAPSATVTAPSQPMPQLNDEQAEMVGKAMKALKDLHKRVKTDFTNVGDKFAEEARKMHYGESAAKPIYGNTTKDEREELADEGIDVYELPDLPSEQ